MKNHRSSEIIKTIIKEETRKLPLFLSIQNINEIYSFVRLKFVIPVNNYEADIFYVVEGDDCFEVKSKLDTFNYHLYATN